MNDIRINFANDPLLPDGICLGVQGEHNAARLVITLPESMITDTTYHTVTVNGVESVWIGQTPNRDGAYRDGNVLYVPITADMTQQTSMDLFVTAYRQDGSVVSLVDKTPTIHGLRLMGSSTKPPDKPGGLAAVVRELGEAVDTLNGDVDSLEAKAHTHANKAVLDGIEAEDVSGWDSAAADAHTHSNKTVLDGIGTEDVAGWDSAAADAHTHTNKAVLDGIGTEDVAGWDAAAVAAHTHANKTTLDKFSGTDAPAFDGHPVPILPVDDIELFQQGETYDELFFATNLEAVPWTHTQNTPYVCVKSINQTYGSEMQIIFSESLSPYTGLPLRMLKVYDVAADQFWTYASRADGSTPPGWEDDDGNPTDAPSVTDFTPSAIVIYDNDTSDYVTYTNFATMPAKAKEALRVISQVVHTTADRVDHPYTPQDAVIRYVGTIEPNRKYAFQTHYNFTLTLPTMPWQTDDAQFVLYLDCTSAIDITFPAGTRFIGGLPETGAGLHKLIGTWRPDVGVWTIGCMESKAVT